MDLEIDESNLTGENKPRRKHTNAIDAHSYAELALSERDNIAFMGTLVRNGNLSYIWRLDISRLTRMNIGYGTGLVVATAKSTEFGHVFELMQQVENRKTPLQVSMNDLGKQLSILSFGIIAVIVLIGLIQRRPWLEMFTIGGN